MGQVRRFPPKKAVIPSVQLHAGLDNLAQSQKILSQSLAGTICRLRVGSVHTISGVPSP